jgi:hypothetical protein
LPAVSVVRSTNSSPKRLPILRTTLPLD